MKLASLIMASAVAVAGTAAFAQNEAPNSARQAGSDVAQSGRQMGHDAKEAGSRIGDAAKRGWNKLRGKAHDVNETAKAKSDDHKDRTAKADHDMKKGDRHAARKDDTRAMGAAPADSSDASRRQRMDDAYANWKNKADVKQ
jgi:hypothetical protein